MAPDPPGPPSAAADRPPAWDYHNPVRIVFGAGRLAELGNVLVGQTVLLVTTPGMTERGVTAHVRNALAGRLRTVVDEVEPDASIDALERLTAALAGVPHDAIVAIGGGSVIDVGKCLSVTLPAAPLGFALRAHLRGQAALPAIAPLPLIAVPTTAGTGAEVTPFATVWDFADGAKYSLTSRTLFPRLALLDPELTQSLPLLPTVSSGLDALSQGLEAIWNRNANPVTTRLALGAVEIALATLPKSAANLRDVPLRARMLQASLLAGLAISCTRTALAHSMSYPLTARYRLPHGIACSFTLPAILSFNAEQDDGRLAAVAGHLGYASIGGLRRALETVLEDVGMDGVLQQFGISRQRVEAVIPEMWHPGRADNNLRAAGVDDIRHIVAAAGDYLRVLRD